MTKNARGVAMITRTVLGVIAAFLLASPALAAPSLAERSPFVQGHWWNRDRSGSGFDVFNTADQAAIVWYTYDEAGKPTWYIAQGALATLGTQSWPLLQQKWLNGRPSGTAAAGTVRLEVVNAESMKVSFDIGGHTGQWTIEPLIASGIQSELDHTGHWFNPSNAGWGFTLTEQGDVLGTVLYTYDAAGAPTWIAGFGRDAARRSVDMYSTTGSCPWCTYRPSVSTKVGTVNFDYAAENDIVIHSTAAVAMASGVAVDGARVTQLGRRASARAADRQLATFDSASLKAYLNAGMENVPVASRGWDFSPAPPASAISTFSTTNVQEQGVDEADVMKTDGRFAYAYRHDSANARVPAIRVAEISGDGSLLGLRGEVALHVPTGPMPLLPFGTVANYVAQAGLYLVGSQVVSVTSTQPDAVSASAWMTSTAWAGGKTNVEVVDVSSAAAPVSRWRAEIDGHLVASRRIGGKLYVITRSVPYIDGFLYGSIPPYAVTANRALLASTPLAAMLPSVRINGGAPAPLVTASDLLAPPQGSSLPFADIVVVTTIDLSAPGIVQKLGVVGPVEAVYVSPANLFLATRRAQLRTATGGVIANASSTLVTDIHQLALGSDSMKVVGSASVEGFLATDIDKAPFRMSESQARLRVVTSTTSTMGWGIRNQANTLTILEPSTLAPGMLRTVSMLPNAARPQVLGRPFEELYATRYVGDRLYAVTFPSASSLGPPVDPLYAIDLANAADPKITGELIVPGFSDYLHPLANGMLLGFGRVVTTTGIQQGLQLSLFDVGSDGAPRVVQQLAIGKRGSDSALLRDHHAISVLERPDGNVNIAFPARIHDDLVWFGTGDSAMYQWKQSGLMRYEVRLSASARGLGAFLPLVTEQSPQSAPVNDAAGTNARSVQFIQGTLYVANGRFWLQTYTGVTTGPL